ncbi:MAG TPA: hypothetical protein VN380_06650 [Thermoanaerobaculia bacterium]|nr:hypothetical protein [Thermoanaerobaculia bacterium]
MRAKRAIAINARTALSAPSILWLRMGIGTAKATLSTTKDVPENATVQRVMFGAWIDRVASELPPIVVDVPTSVESAKQTNVIVPARIDPTSTCADSTGVENVNVSGPIGVPPFGKLPATVVLKARKFGDD